MPEGQTAGKQKLLALWDTVKKIWRREAVETLVKVVEIRFLLRISSEEKRLWISVPALVSIA